MDKILIHQNHPWIKVSSMKELMNDFFISGCHPWIKIINKDEGWCTWTQPLWEKDIMINGFTAYIHTMFYLKLFLVALDEKTCWNIWKSLTANFLKWPTYSHFSWSKKLTLFRVKWFCIFTRLKVNLV